MLFGFWVLHSKKYGFLNVCVPEQFLPPLRSAAHSVEAPPVKICLRKPGKFEASLSRNKHVSRSMCSIPIIFLTYVREMAYEPVNSLYVKKKYIEILSSDQKMLS